MGPSGKILHTFIPEDLDKIFVTNAMECIPRGRLKEDKARQAHAIKCCHNRLIEQVTAHPRRLIVAMGNPAVWSLTGNFGYKITQIRGKLIPYEHSELGILPVVHPAAIARGTGNFRQFKADLEYAWALANGADPLTHERCTFEEVADDSKSITDAIYKLKAEGSHFTGDIETTGFSALDDKMLTFGICSTYRKGRKHVYCFPVSCLQLPAFRDFLQDRNLGWNWHNGKFDIQFFRQRGINAFVSDDTLLLSYCLDETPGAHDLETVAGDRLGAPDYKFMIQPYLPKKGASYEHVPMPVLNEYMAIDVGSTAEVFNIMRPLVRQDAALEKLYTKTLLPGSEFLANVEMNGFFVDQERVAENQAAFRKELDERIEKIIRIANERNPECGNFSVGSPKQLGVVLYDKLGYKKIKNSRSTAKPILAKLPQDDLILEIRAYREVSKLESTYVRGLYKHIRSDGRVHSTYKLHGSQTGRLSSSKPNMQNIPRDIRLRGQFIAPPGRVLISCDLSQAELRSLAICSGDEALCRVYNSGGDIHTELANFMYPGWDELAASPHKGDQVLAKEQRTRCKNVNFGIVYGITAVGLQETIFMGTGEILPLSECQAMIEAWYGRFPQAAKFIEMCRKAPTRGQVISTVFGRRKRIGIVTRANIGFLMNESANFPHQSIASDITLHAGIRTEPILRNELDTRIVNIVHDDIIMEAPDKPEIIKQVGELVTSTMMQVPRDWGLTRVPFESSAEVGTRWGYLKEAA